MQRVTTPRQSAFRGTLLGIALGSLLGASALASPSLPPLLALLATSVAVAVSVPVRPIYFLYALVVVIPFSAALPRGMPIPLLVPSEVVLIVTAGLTILYVVMARRDNPVPARLLVAGAVFGIGTSLVPIAGYAFRGIDLATGDLMSLLAPLQYLILFWICANVPRSAAERRLIVQLMILMGSLVAFVGLLQAADVGPVVAGLMAWYPTAQGAVSSDVGRVTSVFGAWNALGLFLVTTLLLIASTYPDETRPAYRLNMRVATALTLVCLLATNLWSGMIGVVVGFAFIKRLDPRGLRAVAPIVAIALLGVAFLLPEITQRFAFQGRAGTWLPQTLVFRWGVWQDVFLPRIAESPLWGVRPSFVGLAWPHPESQYIGYLYRSGAVSLLAHGVWLALTASWLLRAVRERGQAALRRGLVATSLSLVLVLSLVGIINPVFTYAGTMDYFWIVLGLIVNGGRLERNETT